LNSGLLDVRGHGSRLPEVRVTSGFPDNGHSPKAARIHQAGRGARARGYSVSERGIEFCGVRFELTD
jgi:hypothetical protein